MPPLRGPVRGAQPPALDSICLLPPEGAVLRASLKPREIYGHRRRGAASCFFSPHGIPRLGTHLWALAREAASLLPEAQAGVMGAGGQSWEAATIPAQARWAGPRQSLGLTASAQSCLGRHLGRQSGLPPAPAAHPASPGQAGARAPVQTWQLCWKGHPTWGRGSTCHLFQPLLEGKSFIIKAMLLNKVCGECVWRGEHGVPARAGDGSKHIPGERGNSANRGLGGGLPASLTSTGSWAGRPGASGENSGCREEACHARAGAACEVTAGPRRGHCRSSSPTNLWMSWASSSGSSKAAKWPPRGM